MLCLDPRYSTTKLVSRVQPEYLRGNNDGEICTSSTYAIEGERKKGGLRTLGYSKKTFYDKPLVTIITVVLNGSKYIEDTILSVLEQSYDNVEYIILDGASNDGTVDIIKRYENFIDYWVSEPDSGIYHAFNKGIDLSSGTWINFMNCGDSFYQKNVLSRIFLDSDYGGAKIIYGKHEIIYPSGKRIARSPGKLEDLWKGSIFCHQSSFTQAEFQKRYKFDEKNKIGSDFKFFYTAFQGGASFRQVDLLVSSVSAHGLSDVHRIDSILERWMSVKKNDRVNLFYSLLIIQEIIKSRIKSIFRRPTN